MSGTGSPLGREQGQSGMGVSPGRQSGAEGVEVRMSRHGEIAQRWDGWGWQRVGGTDDGEVVGDAEVADWTVLVPEAQVSAPVDTAVTADQEGPEQGHTFRLAMVSRGASGIMGAEDSEPHDYQDSKWWSGEPWTLEVRAWDLHAALRKAARIGLGEWRRPDGRRLVDGRDL